MKKHIAHLIALAGLALAGCSNQDLTVGHWALPEGETGPVIALDNSRDGEPGTWTLRNGAVRTGTVQFNGRELWLFDSKDMGRSNGYQISEITPDSLTLAVGADMKRTFTLRRVTTE